MDKRFEEFTTKINNIVTDLINEGNYEDFLDLQDSNKCADYSIFLEDELMNKFKKVDLVGFSKSLFIGKSKYEEDEIIENKKKKELCSDISIYYIRVLNLLAAIFSAINPEGNMCLRKLNALYKSIDPNTGEVSVCNDNPKLYPLNFMKMEGIKELSELYTIYNIEGNGANSADIKNEIETLKTTLGQYFKGSSSDSYNNEIDNRKDNDRPIENDENSNVKGSIRNNLKKIRNNIKKLQGNVKNIKESKGIEIDKEEEIDEFETRINEKKTRGMNNNSNNPKKFNNNGNQIKNNNLLKKKKNSKNKGNNPEVEGINEIPDNEIFNSQGEIDEKMIENVGENITKRETNAGLNNLNGNKITEKINQNKVNQSEETKKNEEKPKNEETKETNQQGGNKKTKKNKRKRKTKLSKRKISQRNRTQKGGAGFLRNIISRITPVAKENEPDKKTIKKREENPKSTKDFMKMMEMKRPNKDKILSKMNISEFGVTNLSKKEECKGKKLNIQIDRNNSIFRDFLRTHENITNHYIRYNNLFLSLITDNIIAQGPNNQYQIRRLDNDTLNRIEKDTRKNLLEYYTTCQTLFTEGFALLVDAVDKTGIKEVINTPVNNIDNNNNNNDNKNQLGDNKNQLGDNKNQLGDNKNQLGDNQNEK